MSAIAISRPYAAGAAPWAWRAAPGASRPQPVAGPAPRRPVPAAGGLRITRRGRLVLTGAAAALTGVVVAVAAPALSAPAAAGGDGGAPPVVVTVLPGQTLSEIAAGLEPGGDWRDAALEIRLLNDLPSSELAAGQQLVLPARS